MSNTLKLISKALGNTEDYIKARQLGITEGSFFTMEEKLLWGYIDGYFSRHANVPKFEEMQKLFPTFVIMDVAGTGVSELVERAGKDRIEIVLASAIEEVKGMIMQEQYREAISRLHKAAGEANRTYGLSRDKTMSTFSASLINAYRDLKAGVVMRGVPWPWEPLNSATSGIEPGSYTVLYGRLKSTKTFRLLQIAVSARQASKKVLVVSCELTEELMLSRMAAIECELDYSRLKMGLLHEDEEKRYIDYLSAQKDGDAKREVVVTALADRSENKNVSALRAKIDEHQPDIVLVDSGYKLSDEQTGERNASPQTIRNISYDMQQLAQLSKIPLVVTSQANRKGEKAKLGTTSDAAFSDAFGMDADLLIRLVNDRGSERTVFLIQAAREILMDGFSVGNKCCDGLGPIRLSNGMYDWSIPGHYLEGGDSDDEGGRKKESRFSA